MWYEIASRSISMGISRRISMGISIGISIRISITFVRRRYGRIENFY